MAALPPCEPSDLKHFARSAERTPAASLFCAGALLLGVAFALAQTVGVAGDPGQVPGQEVSDLATDDAPSGTTRREERLREGTEIVDQPGTFRMTGDRITFFTDLGTGRFVVLENLALERIGHAIEGSAKPLRWLVTGTIVEYRGENFLLIRRAVRHSRSN